MNEEVQKLVDSGKLQSAHAEKLSSLGEGVYCFHKSWGVGQVVSWDLLGDRIRIDFEGKPGHEMKLEFAAKSLEVIPETHVMAERLASLDKLKAQAESDPVGLIEKVLVSYDSSIMLDQLEVVLKGTVVPEARYRAWWDSTKKKLRQDRTFVVPPKRNLPLEMRARDVSLEAGLLSDFTSARDLKLKAGAIDSLLKDFEQFKEPVEQLRPVVEEANEAASRSLRLQTGQAIELIHARERLQEKVPELKEGNEEPSIEMVLRENVSRLEDIISLVPAATQRRVYEAFPGAFGDDWPAAILRMLPGSGVRAVGEIAKFLKENEKGEELKAHLNLGIQQRSLSSEVLTWICKERNRSSAEVFSPEVASAVINALERDHYDEDAKRSNRLQDILMNDSTLVKDLLGEANRNQIRMFARRLRVTPALEDLSRNSLLARIIKVHPQVQELVSGDDDEHEIDEGLVVSWESLERKKEQLEDLVHRRIPENTKEISVARSYGDLRENFEFKAAKEMQAVLMRQKEEVESEINNARGTDFTDVDTSRVSIGTVVNFREDGGEPEQYTILGAWDTDLDKGMISYLSSAGQALLGKPVGARVSLPTEDSAVYREVTIESIDAYAK